MGSCEPVCHDARGRWLFTLGPWDRTYLFTGPPYHPVRMDSTGGPDPLGLDRAVRSGRRFALIVMSAGLILTVAVSAASSWVGEPSRVLIPGLGLAVGLLLGGLLLLARVRQFSQRLRHAEWQAPEVDVIGGFGSEMVRYPFADGTHLAALEWSIDPRMRWATEGVHRWWTWQRSPEQVVVSPQDGSLVGEFRRARTPAGEQRLQYRWDRRQAQDAGTPVPQAPRRMRLMRWMWIVSTPILLAILFTVVDLGLFLFVAACCLPMGVILFRDMWAERRSPRRMAE